MEKISETRPLPVVKDDTRPVFHINFDIREQDGMISYRTFEVKMGTFSRDSVIAGIVREKFTVDEVERIMLSGDDRKELDLWRVHASEIADSIFGDTGESPESKVERARERKILELYEYDDSSSVNEFYYNGTPMWFPLNKREGARGAITSREMLGYTDMTYTLDSGVQLTLPILTWKYLLAMVECYAQDCYNVTASHADNIKRLETIEEVMGYDYTTGYPDKIHI